jgi:hypothetical protein
MSLVIWKRFVLGQQYGAGGGHFEQHACMHPLTVFGCPILDKASSSHALLTLDVPEINHPAHCNKIFHDCELGTASDKDVWESLIYSTIFPPAIPLHLSFQ